MTFNELCQKTNRSESFVSFGRVVHFSEGKVTINGQEFEVDTIEEAKEFCKQHHLSSKLEEEVISDIYESQEDKIAKFISEHHGIKVTDTLVESYVTLAQSKQFTLDPVITEIRKLNRFDNILEGRIDYVLDDGSVVTLQESTLEFLNNLLEENTDVVSYMRTDKEKFLEVLEMVEE